MISEQKRLEHKVIEERIKSKVKALLPAWDATQHGGTIQPGAAIRVTIDRPRPYMGRFDAGKENWTIDFEENETYSRKKQIRVKVDPSTGEVSFDEKKLRKHIADLQRIVAEFLTEAKLEDDLLKQLPKMPGCMRASVKGGIISAEAKWRQLTLKQFIHLTKVMQKVQNNLEKDWEWNSFLERLNERE